MQHKTKVFRTMVILIGMSLLPFSSLAWWGLIGHRVVGEIAESWITAKTRTAIRQILGSESIAMSSNWADFIKSDSTYDELGPWHYLNLESGLSKAQFLSRLKSDSAVDAYTKLNFLIGELKKKQLSLEKKKMYLRLLIHIVGDIHQPLHVGHADDLGGNRIKVIWFNDPSNLHSIWDDRLIDLQKLSYTEYARVINRATQTQRLSWQKQPLTDWLFESYQIAGDLYAEITVPDQKLGYRYNYDHLDTLNLQLLKGGIRLAGILNKIFG